MQEAPQRLHSAGWFTALAAGVVALALNIAASIELFEPQTSFGYRLTYTDGFEVAGVDQQTPAFRAGIVVGDRLDFTSSSLHDRIVGLFYAPARLGEPVTFFVVDRGQSRPLTLHAAPVTSSQSEHALFSPIASFLRLAGFVYIAIAVIILLRRPNRMTLGLFLYLVSATDVTSYRFSDRVFPLVQFGSDLLDVAGPIGLIIFAARFPDDRAVGWRALLDRVAIPIGVIFAIPNLAWDANGIVAGLAPAAWMSYGSTFGALLLLLIAVATLAAAYAAVDRSQRQRLQWVTAGLFFTLLSYISGWARYWSTTYPLATSDPVLWSATILYACAPFAIAYAVARQRVFEISFVISRTLIYSMLTATIFGTFALVEWLAGHLLEHTGVASIVIAATAVGIAYSMHAIYARIEQFVEQTLFRRRHDAQRRLAAITAGLPYAENAGNVEEALVREPVQAFALQSADLFMRDSRGAYARDGRSLNGGIVLQLQGRRRSLRLYHDEGVLAVPIFVRSKLEAVAVYGPHVTGEDIDPDERASLDAMAVAAGVAYDHLETARVERDVSRWRRLAERQARELSTLRAQLSVLEERRESGARPPAPRSASNLPPPG